MLIGMLAGYYGGILDAVTMRMADTVFSFSTTLLAILFLGLFKQSGVGIVILAICIADWVRYARTMRASVLEVREEAYITAARATGATDFHLLFFHLLPNALPPIFVIMAVDLAAIIMLEATLSFLGVGVPVTKPSLGMMISSGKNYIYAGNWWLIVFPAGTPGSARTRAEPLCGLAAGGAQTQDQPPSLKGIACERIARHPQRIADRWDRGGSKAHTTVVVAEGVIQEIGGNRLRRPQTQGS